MNFRRAVRRSVPPGLLRGQSLARVITAQATKGLPAKNLKVIGVTGTDGKSTVAYLIASLLRSSGLKVALLSTISVDLADGKGVRPSPKHMTTAGNWDLAKLLKRIKRNKPDWMVMEVSSHALDQRRVWGIPFSVAVMTNLSHEHLDYHQTMARYAAAKARLFELTSQNMRGLRVGIINADDDYAPVFLKASINPVTYGLKNGDWRAEGVNQTAGGLEFQAVGPGGSLRIKSQLVGEFNVYNLLAVIAVAKKLGLSESAIETGIAQIAPPDGRMAKVDVQKAYRVFVDYAVTPNALQKALAAAQQIAGKGKVLLVFGATGDRDRAKRPLMGKIATEGADLIFLTDDETYREDPQKIRDAVYKGVENAGGQARCEVIADRRKAISAALETARAGDIVLVTGLGHQTSRNMAGHDITWNDAEIIKKLAK